MFKRKLVTLLFFIALCTGFPAVLSAQDIIVKGDQVISPVDHSIKEQWISFKKNKKAQRQAEDIYTLPVVFHIIHQNGPENLSDSSVIDAFQRLNDAFANQAFYDQGSGVDTKIRFCLARKDPDGNHTTGITRTYADLVTVNPTVHQALLESLIKWDRDKYLNIWVVSDVDMLIELEKCKVPDMLASGYGGGGMVVASARTLSAIIVHEMGHALGLAHTFQGWCVNNNCLLDGDGICDTPPEETVSITGGCTDPENSCHTDIQSGFTTDQNDLKTNHMDYGNGGCRHDFTPGQKEKMRFVIETFFPGWLTSDVCSNDCASPAEAEFNFPSLNEYSIGNPINFVNSSTGANNYEWSINSVPVSTSIDLPYTFPGQGWYKISLLAKPLPDEIKCRNKQVNWIRVYCSIKSRVKADKKKAGIGEPVHFSCEITDVVNMAEPIQYEWYYNNNLFGTTASFDYSFSTPGVKIFYLVTIRGTCRDTSLGSMVIIKDLPDYTLSLNKKICSDNKLKKIGFSLCNKSHVEVPAGLPVSFYSSNPTKGVAQLVGSIFYTPKNIGPYCCEDFEIEIPAGFTGDFIYGVVNDNHSKSSPYDLANDFPVTSFLETRYTNNLDSLSLKKFSVSILPGDISVPVGTEVNFTARASEPASLLWTVDNGDITCSTCTSTTVKTNRYSRLILKGTSEGGCLASDTIFIRILANGEVFIPTAFTPNRDGLNDYFFVLGGESVSMVTSFMVFNRWGQSVFKKQNLLPNIPQAGWDGKLKGGPAVADTYVYLVTVEFVNGSTKRYKGTVTLIR